LAGRYAPEILSILRIVTTLLLLQHAFSKFFGFPAAMPTPIPLSLISFAGVIELVGGGLVLIGLFTRCAAFVLSGELAFAYFITHAHKASIRSPMAASPRCCSVSSSSISPPRVEEHGAWIRREASAPHSHHLPARSFCISLRLSSMMRP
jgi:hypothetical protein